jgi:hypothetical protein
LYNYEQGKAGQSQGKKKKKKTISKFRIISDCIFESCIFFEDENEKLKERGKRQEAR